MTHHDIEKSAPRKIYSVPVFKVYGTVGMLTKAVGIAGAVDGAMAPITGTALKSAG